ncbi:hypothetical protein BDV93DRAFT_605521 [Ceratobasidium sp. AG-I]|nr:hypothetical protein BDV93DRAFT_605521 [Ceratobasidium sp. AG-I]
MPPKRKTRSGGAVTTESGGVAGEPTSGATGDEGGSSKLEHLVATPSALSSDDIDSALSRYASHIDQMAQKPESKVRELDGWRLGALSDTVRSRSPAYINKEELQKLMDWKLTRGKFRPTLPALIAQNTPDKVKSCTQEAFSALSNIKDQPKTDSEFLKSFRSLLKALCAGLKGVGPATGSLVLSVYDDCVPFMSDEAYIWAMYADEEAESGKKGKKREIKYTEKGYFDYAVRIWEIAESMKRSPMEIERAGWVLGREWNAGGALKSASAAALGAETRDREAELDNSQSHTDDAIPEPKKSKRQKR